MASVKMTVDTRKVMAMLQQKQAFTQKVISSWGVKYSTYYAIYVHEDLMVHHPIGQAKFLEEPARRLAPSFGRHVAQSLRQNSGSLDKAMYDNAKALYYASQPLVPVDTGKLKGSGQVVMGV